MKSPTNASSSSLSAPRVIDTADQLSLLSSSVITLNGTIEPPLSEQVTKTMEQLSTIISQVACFQERLDLVHGAIEQLEQSITAQGNRDANSTSQSCNYPFLDHVIKLKGTYLVLQHPQSGFPFSAKPQATTNAIQGALTSPRRYQSVNRNNLEAPTRRPPVSIASPRFGTASPPSPFSPSINPSLATTLHTENHAASPPAYLNSPSIKTPQQVAADLISISDVGTFYIVTKGREPGIYTNWPKAEALVRGLRHSVHCKKYSKRDAIYVYSDAYKENRLEQVLE